jgi:hypothetical protein
LYVMDLFGKVVLEDASLPLGKHSIALRDCSPGIYFVKVVLGDETLTKRIIVQ